MRFYDEKVEEVYRELGSSPRGLTSVESASRLQRYGYNEIIEKKGISKLKILVSQFASPLIWILVIAVVISALLGKIVDASVIAAILVINAILGFVQEYKAEKAIQALKKLTSLKAKVVRDGKELEIDAKELVPGDIIILETGDKIPADARLLDVISLETQEASLTGESTPVVKSLSVLTENTALADRINMVFSSTIVTKGRAKAIVVGTGMNTEIGRIAGLIQETREEPTPLQLKMRSLGVWLTLIVIGLAIVVFAAGVFKGVPLQEMFLNAVSLAVAVVPEGLPAVVTIALALGVQRMVSRNALVRRLPAVETLGACTVICTDKTGTLTENQMTVRKLFANNQLIEVSGAGYSTEGSFSADPKKFDLLLKTGLLCNNSRLDNGKIIGDPTEAALIVSAAKAGLLEAQLEFDNPRLEEIPFSSERKLMTTINRTKTGILALSKGAPEVLLKKCSSILIDGKERKLTKNDIDMILQKNHEFANQALRVLGFAYKKLRSQKDKDPESGMTFIGLQAMMDPPRPEAKEAIKKCNSAGIRVIMITGDHISTAVAVARELGMGGKAIAGEELDKIDLDAEVESIAIYARVNPEHKIKIIDALKKKGHIVAMTGDGVNDAPALKKADIGIAMGITGTDVAKEASDIILTDDNFASIVNAVEEGRGVYDNIRKFLAFLLSGNIAEILIVTSTILMGLPLPLTAAMILLINLVTDGLPAIALSADPFEPNAMQRKPRDPKESIHKGLGAYIYYYPIIVTVAAILLFVSSVNAGDSIAKSQTIAFFTIVMFELFQAFSARSTRYPALKAGLFKNKYLIFMTLLSFTIAMAVIYIPQLSSVFNTEALEMTELMTSITIALSGFIFIELYKFIKARKEVSQYGI